MPLLPGMKDNPDDCKCPFYRKERAVLLLRSVNGFWYGVNTPGVKRAWIAIWQKRIIPHDFYNGSDKLVYEYYESLHPKDLVILRHAVSREHAHWGYHRLTGRGYRWRETG